MPLLLKVLLYCLTTVSSIIGLIVLYLLFTGLSQEVMRERKGVSVKDEGQEGGMDVDPEELH